MEHFTLQNILSGHGVSISLTGMAIVFTGLLIITVSISLLPKILDLPNTLSKKKSGSNDDPRIADAMTAPAETVPSPATLPEIPTDDEADIASVIGLVLQLECERYFKGDNEIITINRDSSVTSMWGKTNKMRPVPRRRTYAKV